MKDELSRSIVQMIRTDRFYAELILQMDRIISDRVPTAGVCIKEKIQLYVNPTFFTSISEEERIAVLKHECAHILNYHIPRSKAAAPEVYGKTKDQLEGLINQAKHMVVNIACDMSINDGIKDIGDNAVFARNFELPDGQTMEWYLEKLKNHPNLKNLNEYDGHDLWSESEGSLEEVKAKIKLAANKAATNTRAAGNMTADNELLVERLNYVPRDWKSDLKRFAARSQEVKLESSRKRRNRRYGIMYPGIIKEEKLHIGVALDTSGSISDEALGQFMAEVGNIAKNAIITVVEADSEVKSAYTFDPKKQYKVKGRGGTAYQPAFDYFTDETEVDGVIYFGDMDCFDEKLNKPKYPVLWAIVGNQKPPVEWGSQTKIEIKNK